MKNLTLKVLKSFTGKFMGKGIIDSYFPFLIPAFQTVYAHLQTEKIKKVSIPLGLSMYVFTRDIGVGLPLLLKGVYEEKQTQHFLYQLKEDDAVLDIGAHVGYYSLLAGKAAKRGKVYAFEPDSDSASLLKENIKLNKLTNIEVVPAAVADKDGFLYFESQEFNKGESSLSSEEKGYKVAAITLDNWAKNIKKIDIVKMDIEGAEIKALRGGRNTLRKDGIRIYIEYNPRSILKLSEDPQAYLEELDKLGFKIEEIIDESKGKIIPYSKDSLHQTLRHTTYVTLFCTTG